jgi:hypothetical protein
MTGNIMNQIFSPHIYRRHGKVVVSGALTEVIYPETAEGSPLFSVHKEKQEEARDKETLRLLWELAEYFYDRDSEGKPYEQKKIDEWQAVTSSPPRQFYAEVKRKRTREKNKQDRRAMRENEGLSWHGITDEKRKPRREDNLRRAKSAIIRVCRENDFFIMWTFTFSVNREDWQGKNDVIPLEKQRDARAVSSIWNRFLTRFRKVFGRFPYVKILESHNSDETGDMKRGTFHIHFATNRIIDKYVLQALWKHGVVWFDDFRQDTCGKRRDAVKSPANYIAKYIDKDFGLLPFGMRNYTIGRITERPEIMRGEKDAIEVLQAIREGGKDVFEQVFEDARGYKIRYICSENRKYKPRDMTRLDLKRTPRGKLYASKGRKIKAKNAKE